jgi:uncharacterized protein
MTNVDVELQRLLETARRAVLQALPEALAIYVYGSHARGHARPDSDLDVAVLLPPDQPPFDLLDTVSRISAKVGRSVDLVDLRRASDVLRREVLEHGVAAYQADPDRVLEWEAQAMTRYGHYRREVAPILDAFDRTGVGFAP